MKLRTKSVLVVVAAAALSSAASANLVMNGGFETGNLLPEWGVLPSANPNYGISHVEAYEGLFSMRFSNANGLLDGLRQGMILDVGQTYEVSMWVKNYGVGDDSLVVELGGTTAASYQPVPTALESWEYLSFNFTVVDTDNSFIIRGSDPNGFFVDNISVTAVPEPATMSALLIGGLGLISRRKSKPSA